MATYSKQAVVDALRSKGVNGACPMCSGRSWAQLDGFVYLPTGPSSDSAQSATGLVPTVVMACQNCGHMSTHVAGMLGVV
jgi:hypothetical protein